MNVIVVYSFFQSINFAELSNYSFDSKSILFSQHDDFLDRCPFHFLRGLNQAVAENPFENLMLLHYLLHTYRSFVTVSHHKICDFSGETFKGFEVL